MASVYPAGKPTATVTGFRNRRAVDDGFYEGL